MKDKVLQIGIFLILLGLLMVSKQLAVQGVSALPYISEANGISTPPLFQQNQEPNIIYSASNGSRVVYFTMNRDGSDKQAIADTFFSNNEQWVTAIGATFSPDRTLLAFSAVDLGRSYETDDFRANISIHLLDLSTNTVNQSVTEDDGNFRPVWSSDGSTIAYISHGNNQVLSVFDVTTGVTHAVLNSGILRNLVGTGGLVYNFDWSPDGSQLAADTALLSGYEQEGYNTIFVMNADGSDIHQLFPDETYAMSPAWRAQGSDLYFVCEPDENDGVEICHVDLATSKITQVTHLNDTFDVLNIMDLDVSADSQIIFVLLLNGQDTPIDIYHYDLATDALVNLTADIDYDVYAPRWIESQPEIPIASASPDQTFTVAPSTSEPVTLDG